jgi:hypothetical protein
MENSSTKSEPVNHGNGSTGLTKHKVFTCYMCNLYSKYDYYGTRPLDRFLLSKPIEELTSEQKVQLSNSLNNKKKENVILLEKSYICDDPFSQLKSSNYLILGSNCSVCSRMVCVNNDCSFFYYKKRFCLKCASNYIKDKSSNEFPIELKTEILKMMNSAAKSE